MLSIQEIKKFIDEDKTSKIKRQAKLGQRYYDHENDIKDYRIFYYNKDGKLVEDKNALNIRPCSGFYSELIDQKTQFALSNEKPIIDSDNPQLKDLLKPYIDDEFKSELKEIVRYGGIQGLSYLYAFKNEDDRTSFKFAEALGIVEVESKHASDKKNHVIHWYEDTIKGTGEKKDKDIIRIQVWDDQFTYYYVMTDNEIVPDIEQELNPRPHVIYVDSKGKKYYDTFGYIPFLRYDNNRKQVFDLKPIKEYIDDYDLIKYGLSDNILSLSDGYICVKGFQGDDIDELVENVRKKKAIGVSEDGDLEVRTVDIPYEAREKAMERDEKDIYRFGMGLNTSSMAEGNYTNGVNIKSRYSLLDMKCEKVADNLKVLLKKVVKIILDEINEVNNTEFTMKDVFYNLDERETITNALDNATIEKIKAETQNIKINFLLSLQTKLDNETLMKSICEILDIDYEEIKSKLPTNEDDLNADSENILDDIINNPQNSTKTPVLEEKETKEGNLSEEEEKSPKQDKNNK